MTVGLGFPCGASGCHCFSAPVSAHPPATHALCYCWVGLWARDMSTLENLESSRGLGTELRIAAWKNVLVSFCSVFSLSVFLYTNRHLFSDQGIIHRKLYICCFVLFLKICFCEVKLNFKNDT